MNKEGSVIKLIILFVVLFLICYLAYFSSIVSQDKFGDDVNTNSVQEIEELTKSISEDEKKDFNEINVSLFKEIYNGDSNEVVLLSRPTCSYCQIAEPILQNISYKYDFLINHINTDNMSGEEYEELKSLDDRFRSFGTPLLLVVSNNKIVDEVAGLVSSSDYVKFFKKYKFINE